jgi:hypothetical protein
VLNNTSTLDASRAVRIIPDTNLPSALAQMLKDVEVMYGRRPSPLINQLLADPLGFLTNNRIKLGSHIG